MHIFKLPEHVKARVINGYVFDEVGELHVASDSEAELMAAILCKFYGCTRTQKSAVVVEEPVTSSLASNVTKSAAPAAPVAKPVETKAAK